MKLPRLKTKRRTLRVLRALKKRLWSLTPRTIVLVVIALIICGVGASAFIIHNINDKPVANAGTVSNNYSGSSTICVVGESNCPKSGSTSMVPLTPSSSKATPSTTTIATKPSNNSKISCQVEDIPYSTTTQYLNNQYTTYSYDDGGIDGTKEVCSDGTSYLLANPVNKVHYVGTIDQAAQQAAQKAQDAAAYNQIVTWCRNNNPTGGPISGCVDNGETQYSIYGESYLQTLQ